LYVGALEKPNEEDKMEYLAVTTVVMLWAAAGLASISIWRD
tara:strand:+ start:7882 stop:8004 length:123 start_codon:yes stop_codon:yes gene_type:complete